MVQYVLFSSLRLRPSGCVELTTTHCATVCHGNSQSYANGALTGAVASPNAQIVNGFLDQIHEMVRSPQFQSIFCSIIRVLIYSCTC